MWAIVESRRIEPAGKTGQGSVWELAEVDSCNRIGQLAGQGAVIQSGPCGLPIVPQRRPAAGSHWERQAFHLDRSPLSE
jgi:hypothetical protein